MNFKHYKLNDKYGYKRKARRVLDITLLSVLLGVMLGASILELKVHELPSLDRVEIASAHTIAITEPTPWRSVPTLENGSPEQNEKLAYAWRISNYDIEFIYMLRGENGLFTHDRVHDSSMNTVGTDMGLCGTNSYFHPEIVADPKFWSSWSWQMDRCYQMWDGGVTFYARNTNGIIMK